MNAEIWKITIIFKSADYSAVLASEHICKTAYDAWIDCVSQGFSTEDTPSDIIEIEGTTDTADRAPMKVAFLASEVKAVNVLRMY